MLRLHFAVLLLLFAGQALAGVEVWVDMTQTGPIDTNGAVIPRVGKNVNATYTASAGYNGQPTLHVEEKKTGETWTYDVTIGTGATGNPTGAGTGQSVTISARSATPGTYSISVTFKVTFTITKYKPDGTFDSERTASKSGSGSATLTVTDGKFKVVLVPKDNFDPKRSYTTFGLGEEGAINIETIPVGLPYNVTSIVSDKPTVCEAGK